MGYGRKPVVDKWRTCSVFVLVEMGLWPVLKVLTMASKSIVLSLGLRCGVESGNYFDVEKEGKGAVSRGWVRRGHLLTLPADDARGHLDPRQGGVTSRWV